MTREDYDAFCASLPHATHVVQWGGASVWKIGGKVFAVGGWADGPQFAVTFKCSEASFAILKELPGLRPRPLPRLTRIVLGPAHRRAFAQ